MVMGRRMLRVAAAWIMVSALIVGQQDASARADDRIVDRDLAAHPVRRPVACRSGVRARGDPRGGPVVRIEQAGLDDKRLRPLAQPGRGLDADPYLAPFARAECLARPRLQHVRIPLHAHGGPVDLHLVGELLARLRREHPREPRLPLADAEGAVEVDNPGHHAWVEGISAFSAT